MAVRTRDDLARVMAPKMSLTHQDSERYLKELIAYMTKALKNGDSIVFRGFGWKRARTFGLFGSRPKREKLELHTTHGRGKKSR